MTIEDAPKRITILGATGSIGLNTLDLIGRMPDRFAVDAVTANGNAEALADIAKRYGARLAVVADPNAYSTLRAALSGSDVEAAAGPAALVEAAQRPADRIMAAIVGAAGLAPTLAAVENGATVLLANKECLVSAGALFMRTAKAGGATVLPVDSEHSAIFQVLDPGLAKSVERVTLTASGGPFRTWPMERLSAVTPEEAVRHPNWSMGAKISVDSATLMNKGLELIEAHHLFSIESDRLDVLVHPESIVHGLVAYEDGSVVAQMAEPDMRTPIAYSLAWPERIPAPTARLDLASLGRLTFEPPDAERFPALRLTRHAMDSGGGTATVLNAANEIAVESFLTKRIGFPDIAKIVENAIDRLANEGAGEPTSLSEALELDRWARDVALAGIPGRLERVS
jgi:1-deoxy-D-xylulose-5-phosphate reductoisomerase